MSDRISQDPLLTRTTPNSSHSQAPKEATSQRAFHRGENVSTAPKYCSFSSQCQHPLPETVWGNAVAAIVGGILAGTTVGIVGKAAYFYTQRQGGASDSDASLTSDIYGLSLGIAFGVITTAYSFLVLLHERHRLANEENAIINHQSI